MKPAGRSPRRERADASELADAAVTAALVVGILAVGRVLTLGAVGQVVATGVVAVLAARRPGRAVALSTMASAVVALLLGGTGPVSSALVAGLFGWCAGTTLAAGRGPVRAVGRAAAVGWPLVTGATVGLLAVLDDLRELTLSAIRTQFVGLARAFEAIGLEVVGRRGLPVIDAAVEYWWVSIPVLQLGVTVGYALVVHRFGGALVRRVDAALGPPITIGAVPLDTGDPRPVPLHLGALVVERAGGADLVLGDLDTTVGPGVGLVLTGANGSGKSTVIEALAGLRPATGIKRAGPVGLGRTGGTALVRQRPEASVLGARVLDDVRWGLDDGVDAVAALAAVGLAPLARRPTAELSGGELQRLAIAAALARRPVLLLADEVTAMLDESGRVAVAALLRRAVADGVAVVAATHLAAELGHGVIQLHLAAPPAAAAAPAAGPAPAGATVAKPLAVPVPAKRRGARLELDGVGFVHRAASPWAATALHGVNLDARGGELVRVLGPNGAGKTTLIRLLAGVARPTVGEVRLDGKALVAPHRRISVAFQRARLQLLRPTVAEEVRDLAGHDDTAGGLRVMGFDPAEVGARRIDHLSGGQQRRVLLAGLLARGGDVLVLDEPLAGIDAPSRVLLTAAVDGLLARGVLVVVVTHDPTWLAGRPGTDLVLAMPTPTPTPGSSGMHSTSATGGGRR